jgi:hypothetical protein
VYTGEQSTGDPGTQPAMVRGLRNRAFVVKVNRLLRY